MWRNWQTRRLQVPVGFKLVEVRVLSSALPACFFGFKDCNTNCNTAVSTQAWINDCNLCRDWTGPHIPIAIR
jgi:hypothetical protein